MATLTWDDLRTHLRTALDSGLTVTGDSTAATYRVTSRSQPEPRRVWVHGATANCSCKRSSLDKFATIH